MEHTATLSGGRDDVRRATADLAERLPDALAPLAELAFNYRWSWLAGGPELFRSLDPERFELVAENPVRLLQELPSHRLRALAADGELLERAATLSAELKSDLERQPDPRVDPSRPVAFLCAEYGVHVSLPIYSGGLGALAGDLLKQASDSAIALVAVGLMYRNGYFRQRIDASGWQHEYWTETDPERLPAALVSDADGEPLRIEVPIYERDVVARLWRVEVGRVPLLLLDTDVPENDALARWITARLYDSDPQTRLAQYLLLGVGGVRALGALGISPSVIHLNEGHAALAPLELADEATRAGEPLEQALSHARARTVFTTHTPVPAGNDVYPAEQLARATERFADSRLSLERLVDLGRTHPGDEHEPFGVTQAALRLSRSAGGVSRRHGEVAREMWRSLWPEREAEQVPIGHVTNGVHIPTWIGPPMRELLTRHLGEDWLERAADPDTWAPVDEIPAAELWQVRAHQRAELVAHIRAHNPADRMARGDLPEYAQAAAAAYDDGALTIGFARRVATYKRLSLLIRDPDWTLELLGGERPVQVVLAGKAHPRDEDAKQALRNLFGLKYAPIVAKRVVFLEDYDLKTAALLVRGCDVWLNLPRPPLEASGTSGMKAAVNGALNVSVLDGWWAEAYDGENGWALAGEVDEDHEAQDERDAQRLHQLLGEEVVPAFYERDENDIPTAWLARMRSSLRSIGPRFSAQRMLEEYVDGPYQPGD